MPSESKANAVYGDAECKEAHNLLIREFYECLTAVVKPGKMAIVACLRKLLAIFNVMYLGWNFGGTPSLCKRFIQHSC